MYAFCKCRLIPPHQSLARQTACSFLPPKGKPFARFLSYYATKDEESIYTRPHPSPAAPPSPLEGEGFHWFCKLYKKCFELYILQNKFSGTYFPKKTNSDENVTHQSLPLRGGRWRRRRQMRADREDIPRFKVLFALFAHRKEGFPSGGSCRDSD